MKVDCVDVKVGVPGQPAQVRILKIIVITKITIKDVCKPTGEITSSGTQMNEWTRTKTVQKIYTGLPCKLPGRTVTLTEGTWKEQERKIDEEIERVKRGIIFGEDEEKIKKETIDRLTGGYEEVKSIRPIRPRTNRFRLPR